MCLGSSDCQAKLVRFIENSMDDAEKKARLAEQLRANLRKRKAQSRAQRVEERPVEEDADRS